MPRRLHTLPAEPLKLAIRRRARERGSLSDLRNLVMARLNISPRTGDRYIYGILNDSTTEVSDVLADRISIGLGYHPAELFGDDWWSLGAAN